MPMNSTEDGRSSPVHWQQVLFELVAAALAGDEGNGNTVSGNRHQASPARHQGENPRVCPSRQGALPASWSAGGMESLAILDYLAEFAAGKKLWPADAEARAMARSIATEMHGGFADLRTSGA